LRIILLLPCAQFSNRQSNRVYSGKHPDGDATENDGSGPAAPEVESEWLKGKNGGLQDVATRLLHQQCKALSLHGYQEVDNFLAVCRHRERSDCNVNLLLLNKIKGKCVLLFGQRFNTNLSLHHPDDPVP
jgi:hypothetical protein